MLRSVSVMLFAACFAVTGSLSAQAPKPGEKKDYDPSVEKVQVLKFQDTDRGLNTLAAIAVAQPWGQNPLGTIGGRVVASRLVPLAEDWHFVFVKALPLDERYLDLIQDGRPLPDLQFRELRELKGSDLGFYRALNQALYRADQANQEMFERSAADNKHVTYADLKQQAHEHRGKVVSVKGKLVVIRKAQAPRLVKDEIPFVYTAYIQGPTKGSPPYTVVFTELPPELDAKEEEQHAVVTMHGYYLGLIRFQADKENRDWQKDVISPYLVGKTLVVNSKEPAKPAAVPHSYWLVLTGLGGFVLMAAFGAVALMWLKRGDRKIQSQLAQMRDKHTPFSLEPSEEPAAPPNPEVGFKNGAP